MDKRKQQEHKSTQNILLLCKNGARNKKTYSYLLVYALKDLGENLRK